MTRAKAYPRADASLFGNIPAELKALPQWECWKLIQGRKVPINPHTGQRYPKDQFTSEQMGTATFTEAVERLAKDPTLLGLGFRFKKSDPYCGVDLDDCRDPDAGATLSWATEIVEQFGTYTEVSPSRTGIKLICRGSLPSAITKTRNIEMYADGRFFALTGQSLNGAVVRESQTHLDHWHGVLKAEAKPGRSSETSKETQGGRYTKGERHHALIKLAGALHRNDPRMSEEEGIRAVEKLNLERCEPPHKEDHVRRIVRDIWKKVDLPSVAIEPVTKAVLLLSQTLNDDGNAERFLATYGDMLLYVTPWKKWLGWDGRRWLPDERDKVRGLARKTMKKFGKQAFEEDNIKLILFAKSSLNSGYISNLLRESQDQRAVLPEELDHDRDLLNFTNGTLRLPSGELRPHNKEDRITKMVHCAYNPDAHCPTLTSFLAEVVGAEQYPLLMRALGYTLTGHTSEKCTFVCWGPTNAGKTTLLTLLKNFLREYATLIMADSLARHKYQDSNTLSDLADLCGRRFVQTSETREGQQLDEATLKRITPGEGFIRGVRKYELPFEFPPTHKLWLDTNHEVSATGTGDDVWGRIIPFEFGPRIPDDKINRDLPEKLRGEMEGFFALACAEAKAWYQEGLGQLPEKIIATRNAWKSNADRVRRFITECCQLGAELNVPPRVLYLGYKFWDKDAGEKPLTETMFGLKMKELMTELQIRKNSHTRFYEGIQLNAITEDHVQHWLLEQKRTKSE